jgi:hypothetical protein
MPTALPVSRAAARAARLRMFGASRLHAWAMSPDDYGLSTLPDRQRRNRAGQARGQACRARDSRATAVRRVDDDAGSCASLNSVRMRLRQCAGRSSWFAATVFARAVVVVNGGLEVRSPCAAS